MNMNKPSSTREEIIYLLKMNNQLTVADIAKEMNITEMAVRRHIQALERDELIEMLVVRQPMGRPAHVFKLSKKGEDLFPRNYKALTLDILADIEQVGGTQLVKEMFSNRKERLKPMYEERLSGKSREEKLKELVAIQNENGYMAECEKIDNDTFIIKEHNCPIMDVAQHHKYACGLEHELFKELLEPEKVKVRSCIATGDGCCKYEISYDKKK
ncbi:transcriptional regulator [Bacillus sp. HMF5848]|uniref:helix-turn-helix transcriptional regulator n=1 Tax=Bacillus sp. HMF5848 TaxID=2495421 RepID=UPI000F77A77A|nr:metalloregulator ArsR/SmtB family transcription factor [Bacillus sp. HMF5848]RSK28438.1 transcriptional regulator [Bacillus sp. HMF5848]